MVPPSRVRYWSAAVFAVAAVATAPAAASAQTAAPAPTSAPAPSGAAAPAAPAPESDAGAEIQEAISEVGSRTLREGSRGKAVKALQKLLARAGFKTAGDGEYGRATVKVVRRFQRAAHMTVNGVATADVIERLTQTAQQSGTTSYRAAGGFSTGNRSSRPKHLGDRIPLRRGMSGRDVKILQDFLRRAGFRVSIDGAYGSTTYRMVRKFERAKGITNPDGMIDANDLALLRTAVEGPDQGATPPGAADAPLQTTSGAKATVGPDGMAVAPEGAPEQVKQIIAAGNKIAKSPYVYGGGHGKWEDSGYDCSGSVSYALHGVPGLLEQSMPSGGFMNWGDAGPGQWVTIYAHKGHMYMVVAGLRFDTSGKNKSGSRWQSAMRSAEGFTVRHPTGL